MRVAKAFYKLRQYELRDRAGSILVCWLPDDRRVRVGVWLVLKGLAKRKWQVSAVYDTTQSVDDLDFRRHWKVGGLP